MPYFTLDCINRKHAKCSQKKQQTTHPDSPNSRRSKDKEAASTEGLSRRSFSMVTCVTETSAKVFIKSCQRPSACHLDFLTEASAENLQKLKQWPCPILPQSRLGSALVLTARQTACCTSGLTCELAKEKCGVIPRPLEPAYILRRSQTPNPLASCGVHDAFEALLC